MSYDRELSILAIISRLLYSSQGNASEKLNEEINLNGIESRSFTLI